MRLLAAALLAAALTAPASAQEDEEAGPSLVSVGGFLLFYDSQGPLSFAAATRRELPSGVSDIGEVRAAACQYGISIPLSLSLRANSISGAGGRGGFQKALARLKVERPELRGVYDVRVDARLTSVLRVWRRLCTEVTARGFK